MLNFDDYGVNDDLKRVSKNDYVYNIDS